MIKAIFYKTSKLSIFYIATLLFVFSVPMLSHGQDACDPYEVPVSVAANKINITSLDDTAHAVVVHTLQHYDNVKLDDTLVFVEDCPISFFGQRKDDNLHLDIYFPLDELKPCEDALVINSEFNILRVEGVDTNECEFWGESYIYIVGKQGPGR